MTAICLFGALCAVNQSVVLSNSDLDLFDPIISENDSTYNHVISPNESPCPSIFRYILETGEWHGEVTLENVDLQNDVNLRLEISIHKNLLSKNNGSLNLMYDEELKSNQTLIYKVTFPTQNPVPKVKGIYYNEQLICSGPEDTGNSTTTIELSNILKSDQSNLQNEDLSNNETQSATHKNKRAITKKKPFECGVSKFGSTQSLTAGGEEVARGEWPWLVAFYGLQRGKTQFICGANLISKRLVITAAHCVQDKEVKEIRVTTESYVYLGKNDLDNFNEPDSVKKEIEKFVIHPKWNPFDIRYEADIAIIIMDSDVKYSDYIIPICLWKFSDHLHEVVGQQGSLAGWGYDEFDNLSSEYPKMINVKIISDGNCYRNFTALAQVSSEEAFCAAGGEHEAPCKGDSGGGLIIKKQNKWYLRGLVSASEKFVKCLPGSPALFTDVAKFKEFIQSTEIQIKKTMSDCGTRDPAWVKSPGNPSSIRGEWPWLVAFYDEDKLICSGTLISTTEVIVAAHCIQDKGKSTIRGTRDAAVFIGKHNLDDFFEGGSMTIGVERFIVHPEWKPFDVSYDADIAIIVMDSPVEYNQYIRPICLGNEVYRQYGSVAGWRSNDNLVYHVKVFETGLSTCSGRDNEHPFVKASSPRTLCVGYTYDVAPCRIDTGGGLITSIEDKFYLKGLVAGSLATDKIHCESSSYGVFTDVSKFEDWIAANTNV